MNRLKNGLKGVLTWILPRARFPGRGRTVGVAPPPSEALVRARDQLLSRSGAAAAKAHALALHSLLEEFVPDYLTAAPGSRPKAHSARGKRKVVPESVPIRGGTPLAAAVEAGQELLRAAGFELVDKESQAAACRDQGTSAASTTQG